MTEALKKRNYLLFPLLLLLTGWIIFRETSPKLLWTCLTQVKPLFLIAGGLCTALFLACEASNLGCCLKQCGHQVSFRKQMRYALTGVFFSGIKPCASGGQPMQLLSMTKDKIPSSCGALCLAAELASFQAASVLLAGFSLLFYRDFIFEASGLAIHLIAVAFAANLILLLLLILAIFKQNLIKSLLRFSVQFLPETFAGKFYRKVLYWLDECSHCSVFFRQSPLMAVRLLGTSVLQLAALHSIPFWIYLSMGLDGISALKIIALQSVLFLAVSLIPLPGGICASESGFMLLYQSVFPSVMLDSGMILSRFLSFYLPMLLSGLLLWCLRRKVHAEALLL